MRPVQDLQHATHCGVVSHLQLDSGSHAWRDANSYIYIYIYGATLTKRPQETYWISETWEKCLMGFPMILGGNLNMEHASPISWHCVDPQNVLASPAWGCWYGLRKPKLNAQGFLHIQLETNLWKGCTFFFPQDMTGGRKLLVRSCYMRHIETQTHLTKLFFISIHAERSNAMLHAMKPLQLTIATASYASYTCPHPYPQVEIGSTLMFWTWRMKDHKSFFDP